MFALALSLATLVWAVSFRGPWRQPGAWFGLALIGEAAALQLVEAGNQVTFQHYIPVEQWAEGLTPIWLLVLLFQALLVGSAVSRHRVQIAAATELLPRWGWIILGASVFLSSAALSRDLFAYAVELVVATSIQLVQLATVCLAAFSAPAGRDRDLGVSVGFDPRGGVPGEEAVDDGSGFFRFALIASVWVVLLAGGLNLFSYQRHPHVPDEVVYMIHARYLAEGMLELEAPPSRRAFDVNLMTYERDRWYSPTPPGWPLALAVGYLIGLPWLVNSILGGLTLLGVAFLVRRLYDEATARWSVALLAVSPWFVFLAMSFMTHMVSLACATGATLAVEKARDGRSILLTALAGVCIGALTWVRPAEGLVIAVLLGVWSLGFGGRPLPRLAVLTLVVSTALATAAILPYNEHLTGSPTQFPIQAYTDNVFGPGTNAFGFGANRGLGWSSMDPFPGHGPVDAAINAALNSSLINVELFGWGSGSLWLLSFFLLSGGLRRSDLAVLGVVVGIVGIHIFYYFSGGPDFGARYWFLAIVSLVVLTVRGGQRLAERLAGLGIADSESARRGVGLVLVMSSVLALLTFLPWRAVDRYRYYRDMRPGIEALARTNEFGRSLVLVRGGRHPDYASAVVYNPLDLWADVPIYAWDRDAAARLEALAAYPDRPVWIVDGPTVTGGGYRVVEGPILPEQRSSIAR